MRLPAISLGAAFLVLVSLLLIAACGDDDDDSDPGESETGDVPDEEELAGGVYTIDDCPLDDTDFCAFAVEVANALAAGDFNVIVQLSAETEINCDEVAVESFPTCSPGEAQTGYLTTSPQGVTQFLTVDEYRSLVQAAVEPQETEDEELGPGVAEVVGVGTRGEGHDLIATSRGQIEGEPTDLILVAVIDPVDDSFRITGFSADSVDAFAEAGFAEPLDLSVDVQPWGDGGSGGE